MLPQNISKYVAMASWLIFLLNKLSCCLNLGRFVLVFFANVYKFNNKWY